jgi:hypothetical protein
MLVLQAPQAIPETLKVDSKEEPWDVVKSKDMLQVPMESQPKSESSDLYKQGQLIFLVICPSPYRV